MTMQKNARIYIAGHQGLVGSALIRALLQHNFCNLITRSLHQLDLRNQQMVNQFFEHEKPEYVFVAAAKVGGIQANIDYPAQFIYDNLMIATNIIDAAYRHTVKKLLFLGSSCSYPRNCPQPMREEYLLTSPLEETNEPYAIAKIAGIKLCQSYNLEYGTCFISCMPTNLYGPHDTFDVNQAHVIPGLIAKMYHATLHNLPTVEIWGTGTPRREFLFVDDVADALIFLMNTYVGTIPINIGVGHDITLHELALLIKKIVGFNGTLVFNTQKPDGTPRKLLTIERLTNLGWTSTTSLEEGITQTVRWYRSTFRKEHTVRNIKKSHYDQHGSD